MQQITIKSERTIDVPDYGTPLQIDQIVELVKRSGSHFFDADTMRFFKSKVDSYAVAGPDGWYFVTSEKHESAFARINEPRKYTVRRLSIADTEHGQDLHLYELEGFQRFETIGRARTAARKAAQEGTKICPDCKLRISPNDRCAECEEYRQRHQVSA